MKIRVFIIVAIVALATFMVMTSVQKLQNRKYIGSKVKVLSTLLTEHLQSVDHTSEPVSYLQPTLLVYLNSECNFCIRQTELINENNNLLDQYQLILVSFEPAEQIRKFIKNYENLAAGNYFLYNVDAEKVEEIFGRTTSPQLFIYQDNLLVSSHKGITEPNIIIKSLQP